MPCHFTGISVLKHKGWGVNYSLFLGSTNLYTSKPCLNIEIHIARIPLPNSFWCGLQQWYGVRNCIELYTQQLSPWWEPSSLNPPRKTMEIWRRLKLMALLGDQKLIKNNLSLTWSLHSNLPPIPTPPHTGCLSRREVKVTLRRWQLVVVFPCALSCTLE